MTIHETQARKYVDRFLKEDLIHEEAKISAVIMLNELITENKVMGRLAGVDDSYMGGRIKSLELTIEEIKKLKSPK